MNPTLLAVMQRLVDVLPNLGGAMGRLAPAIQNLGINTQVLAKAGSAIGSSAVQFATRAAGMFGVGSAAGTAGASAAGLLGSVGGMTGPIAGAIVALVALGNAAVSVGKSLLEANRHLAEFSPAMAGVFARSQVRDIQRDMKAGQEQAGSADFLATALGDLQDTMQPILTLLANIMNVVGGVLMKVVDLILTPLSAIADAVNKILAFLFGNDSAKYINVGQWVDEIADEAKKKDQRGGFKHPDLPRD